MPFSYKDFKCHQYFINIHVLCILYNPNNDLNNKMFSVSVNIVLGDSLHTFKGRSRRLRPKAHISDDPFWATQRYKMWSQSGEKNVKT